MAANLNEKEQAVLEAMKQANRALKSGEIAELSGIDKKEVSKIISKLKKLDLVYSPKRCYYQVKA